MKYALILLGIVAAIVLTLGAFNRELAVDVDYVIGVWRSVNGFWLFAIAAGLILAAGLVGALLAQASGWRARGKLEKELLEVYRRLRAVEAEAEKAAGATAVAAPAEGATETEQTAASAAEDVAATAVSAAALDDTTVTAVSAVVPDDTTATAVSAAALEDSTEAGLGLRSEAVVAGSAEASPAAEAAEGGERPADEPAES